MDSRRISLFEDRGLVASQARGSPDTIVWGLGCSAVLHVIALLLVFGFPGQLRTAPPIEEAVSVELVSIEEVNASSGRQREVGGQQEKPPASPEPQPSNRIPSAELKPQPPHKPANPPKREASKHDPLAEAEPRRKSANDDIQSLLAMVEKSHQRAATLPGQRPENGPVSSESTATGSSAGRDQKGARGVKDFIRAQIERHWEFDPRDLGTDDLVIAIHLELNADGSVRKADVVDNPRYGSDLRYRSLAVSARNAALTSSPLHFPPGTYDAVKDITLNLNPREALR